MAKKHRSKKEQEALVLKGVKIGCAVFAAILALTVLAAVVLPSLSVSLRPGYFFDPWDNGSPFNAFVGTKEIFAYSTAIEAIEQEMGMRVSEEPYTYLAVDLKGVEESMKEPLKNFFTYWGEKSGKKVLFANKEELIEQGLMQKTNHVFTDGCLVSLMTNEWSEDRKTLEVQYFFHQGDFEGVGFTVVLHKEWNGWQAEEDIGTLRT